MACSLGKSEKYGHMAGIWEVKLMTRETRIGQSYCRNSRTLIKNIRTVAYGSKALISRSNKWQ